MSQLEFILSILMVVPRSALDVNFLYTADISCLYM